MIRRCAVPRIVPTRRGRRDCTLGLGRMHLLVNPIGRNDRCRSSLVVVTAATAPPEEKRALAAASAIPRAAFSQPFRRRRGSWDRRLSTTNPAPRRAGDNDSAPGPTGSSSSSLLPPPPTRSMGDPADRDELLRDWFPASLHFNPWDAEASALWIPCLEARRRSAPKNSTKRRRGRQAAAAASHPSTSSTEFEHPQPPSLAEAEAETRQEVAQLVQQIDVASRHVIQLLQELHLNQHPVSFDRVTTRRCLVVLNQLLDFGPPGRGGEGNLFGDTYELAGRAERARAIVTGMQRFEEERGPDDEAIAIASAIGRRRPYQAPRPSRDAYQTALRIYADAGAPDAALETVAHMADRHARHGDVELKPSGFHWNCVLLAWENASAPRSSSAGPSSSDAPTPLWDRSVPAAKVFLDNLAQMDDSCYKTMMRICTHGRDDSERAAELGGSVAVKVWQEAFERGLNDAGDEGRGAPPAAGRGAPDLSSHFYAFFFQAIRGLPLSSPLRDAYYRAGFQRALEHGKVNAVLVNEFLVHNTSASLFNTYIRPHYDRSWNELKPARAAERILQRMPASWRDRADGVTGKYGVDSNLD